MPCCTSPSCYATPLLCDTVPPRGAGPHSLPGRHTPRRTAAPGHRTITVRKSCRPIMSPRRHLGAPHHCRATPCHIATHAGPRPCDTPHHGAQALPPRRATPPRRSRPVTSPRYAAPPATLCCRLGDTAPPWCTSPHYATSPRHASTPPWDTIHPLVPSVLIACNLY